MIALRDVTLRDGLQDEDPISTDNKLALYEALVAAGIHDLELTSFVRPDRVPAMADADELCRRTTHAERDGITRWGLVLNRRGAERAIAAGLHHLQFVVSVSEAHNLENAGQSVDASFAALGEIVALASDADAAVEITLSTAFGCPFAGPIPAEAVAHAVKRSIDAGVAGISLADTIGTAVPTEVRQHVEAAKRTAGDTPVGVHLHDTRGLGIANALAAIEAGVDRLDGTVGGLGGCPFAPGASGNIALEDLVHGLHAMGEETGIDLDRLLGASRLACDLVGRQIGSHVGVAGPRFANTPHATTAT